MPRVKMKIIDSRDIDMRRRIEIMKRARRPQPTIASLTPRQQVALKIWMEQWKCNQVMLVESYRLADLFLEADKEGK